MAEIDEQKKIVSAHSADKILYYYKLISHEPQSNPCHPLGTQAASSTTNTATLGTTPTKQFNIKDTGSINQQRVVHVVMTDDSGFLTDVARDLFYAWEHHETIGLWRVDWNTMRTVNGKQVVNAEYSQVVISALPETEALNTAQSSNVTFEVSGLARRYDEDGNPFTLSAEDFDQGMFAAVARFYNFAKPGQVGLDSTGVARDTATDDSHGGDQSYAPKMGAATTPGGSSSSSTNTVTPSPVANPSGTSSSH